MKRIIILSFLLLGCSYNEVEVEKNSSNKNFSRDLTFLQFEIKLDEYTKNSTYPNLEN